MRIFNDAIENSVGVNSSNGGEFIGVGYSPYVPPVNGIIVQGNVGIGTSSAAQSLVVQGNTSISGFVTAVGFFGPATNLTNLNASNITQGTIGSTYVSGTYTNITQIGTQSTLNVSGFVTSAGFFGPGTNLTNLNASNITQGTIGSTYVSGSYTNITQIGTQSQLNVSGFVTSTGFFGPGTNLTNLNASNLALGTVPSARISGTYSGITSIGTLSQLNVFGIITSGFFFGDGSNLTNLNASNLALGTVPSSVISGTYSGITSVGTLSQLNVSGITTTTTIVASVGIVTNLSVAGITTVSSIYYRSSVFDINNSRGSLGNILASISSGVAWSTPVQLGLVTGSASATQIAYWNNANQIIGSNNFVITGLGSVGIGTATPTQSLHIQGGARLTGTLYDTNNLPGSQIGVVTQYLASTGAGVTWTPVKRSLVTQLMTAYTPSSTGVDSGMFIVPQDPNDGVSTMNFTFKRVNVRVETPSAGISTINVVKYIGTSNASGLQTAILSSNIILTGATTYEGFSTSFATGFSTCASSDKLAVNFIGYSTSHSNFTVEIIMRET